MAPLHVYPFFNDSLTTPLNTTNTTLTTPLPGGFGDSPSFFVIILGGVLLVAVLGVICVTACCTCYDRYRERHEMKCRQREDKQRRKRAEKERLSKQGRDIELARMSCGGGILSRDRDTQVVRDNVGGPKVSQSGNGEAARQQNSATIAQQEPLSTATLPRRPVRPSWATIQPGQPLDPVHHEIPPPSYAASDLTNTIRFSAARARMMENGFLRQRGPANASTASLVEVPDPLVTPPTVPMPPQAATALSSHPPFISSTPRPETPIETLPAYTEADPVPLERFGGGVERESERERTIWEGQRAVRDEDTEVMPGGWREEEGRAEERRAGNEVSDESALFWRALTGGAGRFGGIA